MSTLLTRFTTDHAFRSFAHRRYFPTLTIDQIPSFGAGINSVSELERTAYALFMFRLEIMVYAMSAGHSDPCQTLVRILDECGIALPDMHGFVAALIRYEEPQAAALVQAADFSSMQRYPALTFEVASAPVCTEQTEYVQIVSDDLDYEAIALAKVAELRAEAGLDPECAAIGIEVSAKAPAAVKRDLLAAHAFVESRAASKASRPLRIAADPVKVASTVTKAKKRHKPAYPHCGSGLQNAPVVPVVQKPVALMVMLVSMVQLSIVLVQSVCADAAQTRISVEALGALCGRTYANKKFSGFKQTLRMQPTITHKKSVDSAFSKMLDDAGFPRSERATWLTDGVPSTAAVLIQATIQAW